MKLIHASLCVLLFFIFFNCESQNSNLISLGADGKLIYKPDSNGNKIPDFSMVGYHQGEKAIPYVPTVIILNPSTGDRRSDIQNAIDSISAMPINSNGHRGALLLKAGYYEVSGSIKIATSGIVIRGEGKNQNGTIIEITQQQSKGIVFSCGGTKDFTLESNTEYDLLGDLIPIGTRQVVVQSGHNYSINDRVMLKQQFNLNWVKRLKMDLLLSECGPGHSDWKPKTNYFKRKIILVKGDTILLDAPVVDPIEKGFSSGSLVKYSRPFSIEEVGIENIRLQSSYNSPTDIDHAWVGVEYKNIENAWVRNVNAYYFCKSAVSLIGGSYQVTVENCGMYDYKSPITGGYRYGFNSDDSQLALFRKCKTTEGRHDFVQGSDTEGPNVFTRCESTNSYADDGPHHRYSMGTLWDVIKTDNQINIQNRKCSGSGHGWAGAQQVLWNCTASKMVLHDLPGNATNWAIGCNTSEITNIGQFNNVIEPLGVVESLNKPITSIPSLYESQLISRIGGEAIHVLGNDSINFSINKVVCFSKKNLNNLGKVSLEGGRFFGKGVIDDGNGKTFSFNPNAAGLGKHEVIYIIKSKEECQQIAFDSITVVPSAPVVNFTKPISICLNAYDLNNFGSAIPTGGIYSGNGVKDNGNGKTFSFNPSSAGIGIHDAFYTFSTINNCTNSDTAQIEVLPSPNKKILFNAPVYSSLDTNSSAKYSWVDCKTLKPLVPAEINKSLITTTPGDYALIIETNGCKDTSDCFTITTVNVNEKDTRKPNFKIIPNPSNGNFTISFPTSVHREISIFDAIGHLAFNGQGKSKDKILNLNLIPGIYFVKIQGDNTINIDRIIIK